MSMSLSAQRRSMWLACLAILLASLLPFLPASMAAEAGQGPGLVEVCTASGAKWVVPGKGDRLPAPAAHGKHCGLCWTPPATAAPAPSLTVPAPIAVAAAPGVPAAVLRPAHAGWTPTQPRAPPASFVIA